MPQYLTDIAICVRVTDFSETSQIVGLFTRAHGLVPLIAKGAKRPTKKNTMSGPLDLLTTGEAVFILPKEAAGYSNEARGGGSQLGTLAGWQLTNHRAALRQSLGALNGAMICAEATTHLVQPLDPHEILFDELQAAFELLALPAQRLRAVVAYLKAALTEAGYWPQLAACLACGRPVSPDETVRFARQGGGVICAEGRCTVDGRNAHGPLVPLAGRVAVALDRLPLPAALLAHPPERPVDEAAVGKAMALLLGQVEGISGKGMRTGYLAGAVNR